jgi:hypothetical protein
MALSCWTYNTVAAAPVDDRLSCLVYSYPGGNSTMPRQFNRASVISSNGPCWPLFCSGLFSLAMYKSVVADGFLVKVSG